VTLRDGLGARRNMMRHFRSVSRPLPAESNTDPLHDVDLIVRSLVLVSQAIQGLKAAVSTILDKSSA
jgi:hypothetical protein